VLRVILIYSLVLTQHYALAVRDLINQSNLRTVFGTRLRLLFAIGSGLRCRGKKRDPAPDLLTSSAFLSIQSRADTRPPS